MDAPDEFENKSEVQASERYSKAIHFEQEMDRLLSEDRYIARSDYRGLKEDSKKVYESFNSLREDDLLEYYCEKNKLRLDVVTEFLKDWEDVQDLKAGSKMVREHNEAFYSRHLEEDRDYLDHVLDDIDPAIDLDEGQRRVVLCDEDHALVIAGAGAGKTTAVAARVKYLVDKKCVDPNDILVVSFSNAAVDELRERIQKKLRISCHVSTFHSIGFEILRKNNVDKKNVMDEGGTYNTINDYFKSAILTRPDVMKKLLLFFSSYFDPPHEEDEKDVYFEYIQRADFSTMKANMARYNKSTIQKLSRRKVTAGNELLRSFEEVKIANWLYLHSIDYEYESNYQYHIYNARKPYTPDFKITQGEKTVYIEHFGISEDGKNSRYTEEDLKRYKKSIEDKKRIHSAHGTDLICTYSKYMDGVSLEDHLQRELENRGFKIVERDSEEVFKQLVSVEENKYISKFVKLVARFINLFKAKGCGVDDFEKFKKGANERSKLFLDICKDVYLNYEMKLNEKNSWDFNDMINEATKVVTDKSKEWGYDYKYIIVDEYQDISEQRFDLVKTLSEHSDAKITAVGDDWQSIYSFSGSDVSLFTHFCDLMGDGEVLTIKKTYRNPQEVIDIAGNFVQKNPTQIKKALESEKTIKKPVVMWVYDEEHKKYEKPGEKKSTSFGAALSDLIARIVKMDEIEGRGKPTIALVGRYNFDGYNIGRYEEFRYDKRTNEVTWLMNPDIKITFITAHCSKGLGFDDVVITNAKNDVHGFPSKVDDEPILKYVMKKDRSYEFAEERRLFYVAMTRTRNRVYMMVPENNPSNFVQEIIADEIARPESITLIGDSTDKEELIGKAGGESGTGVMKRCPICGYPLLLRAGRNKISSMWICSNEPEICTYMTNMINPYGLGVHKCNLCRDGYLVVKKSKTGDYFLGCTEYRTDGKGCGNMIGHQSYKSWLGKSGFVEEDFSSKHVYSRNDGKTD